MNRTIPQHLALAALLSALVASQARTATTESTSELRPNILLIYTDDQGYGDVSALNPNAKFQTPNFDRLANEGIAFTNGHSADSVCTPSRYGLLTGRYPWRHEFFPKFESSLSFRQRCDGREFLNVP